MGTNTDFNLKLKRADIQKRALSAFMTIMFLEVPLLMADTVVLLSQVIYTSRFLKVGAHLKTLKTTAKVSLQFM